MPHIEIWDARNTCYTIDSSDRETVARWLGETVERLGPESADFNTPLRIQVYPRMGMDGRPDWYTNTPVILQRYDLNKIGLQYFLDDLRRAGIDVPETTRATA